MDGALPFVSGVVAGWRRTISPRALVSRSHRGDLPSLGIDVASTDIDSSMTVLTQMGHGGNAWKCICVWQQGEEWPKRTNQKKTAIVCSGFFWCLMILYDIFILYALATWGLKLEQSQVAVILIEIDRGWLDMESWELALKAGWEDSKSSRHCSWMQLAKPSR